MRMLDHFVLPLGVFLLAMAGGVLADRAARLRREDGDRGDFWTRVVSRVCFFLALPLLLSWAVQFVPQIWQSGWHLLFDLTGAFGWSQPFAYRLALLLPFVVWALLLVFGLAEKPGGRDAGRWLAGTIGVNSTRLWVLVWTIPFAAVLIAKLTDLGGGPGTYPGAVWGTIAVLLLSIIGVALSAGHGRATVASPAETPNPVAHELRPWPQAMESNGVQLRHVASWPASTRSRRVRAMAMGQLDERLRQRNAVGVAPELIEAVDRLLATGADENDRSRLIFAPDGCGQTEVVALAAELLEERFHAATLVVTASGASTLAEELGRWLRESHEVAAVEPSANFETNAQVVVVDAQVLSDWLLPQLKNPLLLKRFGLIVWWHLEQYTGVLAANLWAISRRLHRLLEAMGRHDVRTLVFVRSTPHGGAQLAAFVRRLLPHPLPVECEVHVEARIPRTLDLHLLESHHNFFSRGAGRNVQERHRHLPLVAAKVSTDEGWPTFLEVPPDIDDSEAEAFLQLPAGDDVLRTQLRHDSASASARIRKIQASEILSLVEIIGQGGRATSDSRPHHVGITLPPNPYVAYLLSTLSGSNGGTFPTSRRLVSAAAQPSVIRRHLLLALDELPDTRSGLLKNFLLNEDVIRRTLDEIAHEGKLTRKEVRVLDHRGELRREHEYKSQKSPTGEWQPLDTIGADLISVRDPGAGHERGEGIRMRVDRERLTIQAYPHRVFVSGGRRHRIYEWKSVEDVRRTGWVDCGREDVHSTTWRIRNSWVFGIDSSDAPVGVGRRGKLLSRITASLQYSEEVFGVVRLTPDLTSGVPPMPETVRLARPVGQSFATKALILRFSEDEDSVALASLAEALRHVLPVHLGVEEDALEVVPLTGEMVQGRATFGLAIVDLYPGGIGLVDAIRDDAAFLLQLLEWSRDWLAACPCQNDQGCARCLRSPASLAANSDQPPLRAAALSLLRQIG